MKKIAGVVVLFVAFIETHTRRHVLLRRCKKGEGTDDDDRAVTAIVTDDPQELTNADAPATGDFPIESTKLTFTFGIAACNPSPESESVTNSASTTVPTPVAQDPPHSNDGAPSKSTAPAERVEFGCNRVTSDTVIAGGLSGFLGGMIGIRTPPLMLYFLHPPKPLVFDNHSQRATGVVIMCTSTVFRQVFYLYETFTGGDVSGYQSEVVVYQKEDWKLYVYVVAFSILGGWVGGRAFEYVKNARETIRGIFLVLLYMCGASLFISAFTA